MLSIITAAVAPGIALLAYFYLKDRYQTEPILMVARMFLAGALIVFPTMVLQRALVLALGDQSFLYAYGISAGLEEFMKWFLLYYLIYKNVEFDEPYDGIVYAVAVSLGYATVENVLYAIVNFSSFSSLLFRAFLPVSGHALFGVFMGYYLGMAKFRKSRSKVNLASSFLMPVIYHGTFDLLLLSLDSRWLWLMVPLMLLFWIRSLWKVNQANARSPLRTIAANEEVKI